MCISNRSDFRHCSRKCRRNHLEPPCTDPYARWCGRGQRVTAAPMPIKSPNRRLSDVVRFRANHANIARFCPSEPIRNDKHGCDRLSRSNGLRTASGMRVPSECVPKSSAVARVYAVKTRCRTPPLEHSSKSDFWTTDQRAPFFGLPLRFGATVTSSRTRARADQVLRRANFGLR